MVTPVHETPKEPSYFSTLTTGVTSVVGLTSRVASFAFTPLSTLCRSWKKPEVTPQQENQVEPSESFEPVHWRYVEFTEEIKVGLGVIFRKYGCLDCFKLILITTADDKKCNCSTIIPNPTFAITLLALENFESKIIYTTYAKKLKFDLDLFIKFSNHGFMWLHKQWVPHNGSPTPFEETVTLDARVMIDHYNRMCTIYQRQRFPIMDNLGNFV